MFKLILDIIITIVCLIALFYLQAIVFYLQGIYRIIKTESIIYDEFERPERRRN